MSVPVCDSPPREALPPRQRAAESAADTSHDSGPVPKWVWPTTSMSNPPGGTAPKEMRLMVMLQSYGATPLQDRKFYHRQFGKKGFLLDIIQLIITV